MSLPPTNLKGNFVTFFNKIKQIFSLDTNNPDNSDNMRQATTRLARELQLEFPDLTLRQCTIWASYCGLFCRVAFMDVNVSKNEATSIHKMLHDLLGPNYALVAESLGKKGIADMKTWVGIDGHLYCDNLKNEISLDEKINLINQLFKIAGSDGIAENQETQEIKLITQGLLLDDKEYYAARARNKEFLGALKKDL